MLLHWLFEYITMQASNCCRTHGLMQRQARLVSMPRTATPTTGAEASHKFHLDVMRELYNDTCDPSLLTPLVPHGREAHKRSITTALNSAPFLHYRQVIEVHSVVPEACLRVREGFKSE